jgi:uncharacterized membrane protein (DUF4010 family)
MTIEVYVINNKMLQELALPILLMCTAGFASVFLIYRSVKNKRDGAHLPMKNPLNFIVAIKFAIIYALVIWLVKFLSIQYGDEGIYIAAVVSGFTDIDAITISMANAANKSAAGISEQTASNAIIFAALSNTFTKLIILLVMGDSMLRKTATPGFAAILITGWIYLLLAGL